MHFWAAKLQPPQIKELPYAYGYINGSNSHGDIACSVMSHFLIKDDMSYKAGYCPLQIAMILIIYHMYIEK